MMGSFLRFFYFLAILHVTCLPAASEPLTLNYYIHEAETSLQHLPNQFELRVVEGTNEYVIELEDKHEWYSAAFYKSVYSTVDLDGDKIPEAIIETYNGGNCCGPTFYVIKRVGPGFYSIIESKYLTGWPSVDIQQTQYGKRLVVTNTSEGVDNTSMLETRSELELSNGRLELVSHYENNAVLTALSAVTSEELRTDKARLITFDMDRDGTDDELNCNYWERWGAVSCELTASAIGKVFISGGCNRIGILELVHNGVHTLACDRNRVLKWESDKRIFE